MPSRPGVAQISFTLARPSGVSIMANTRVVALASAGTGPIRRAERMGPYERPPMGGYLAAATAAAASSAVLTSGTMTPTAPASRALPMAVRLLSSTRTMPTAVCPASMAMSPFSTPE